MYIDNLKILFLFEDTNGLEEISQTSIDALGDNTTFAISSNGEYVMRNDQYLHGDGSSGSGYSVDISSDFTMGFKLYSINNGVVSNPSNGSPESITLPIIDFVSTNSFLRLEEVNYIDGNNFIKVTIGNGSYILKTDSYSPGYWHYIWVAYNSSTLSIYIDGVLQNLTVLSGSHPGALSISNAEIYINHSIDGYGYNIAKNTGYIDDIFMMNEYDVSLINIQSVINNGILFLVDKDYISTVLSNSFYMDDPYSINVVSFVDDLTYIYIGRNDGKILRGSPLLWEVRRMFNDSQETSLLKLNGDVNNKINSEGLLEIKNKMVRL